MEVGAPTPRKQKVAPPDHPGACPVHRLGLVHVEDLEIVQHLTRGTVHAEHEPLFAGFGGRRQPDLVVPNDWGGPTLVVDGRLPESSDFG